MISITDKYMKLHWIQFIWFPKSFTDFITSERNYYAMYSFLCRGYTDDKTFIYNKEYFTQYNFDRSNPVIEIDDATMKKIQSLLLK